MTLAKAVKDVFIVAAKRTPFGTYGGKLAKHSAIDLQEVAARAALESADIQPEWISSVVVGNVFSATSDGPYISRHTALRIGIPDSVPALAVNRMCGSGFQSIVNGTQEIEVGLSEVVLTGGAETMSLAPHIVHGARFGTPLGVDLKMEDLLWQGLIDKHVSTPMGMTAENLAMKYGITRQQTDEFSYGSQQRWKAAHDAGYFDKEIAPIPMKTKKGVVGFTTDEHPRPETELSGLAKLPSIFKKDGTVTAGSASGISDGAGAVVLASATACANYNMTPLARVIAYGIAGCDPTIMGIGPVPAIHGLLQHAGMTLADVDLVEVNEAFAAQYLAVEKELGLDREKTNVNGGAIAMGHPVGASGSRIITHLCHELRRRGARYGIGSACIGGGQGIAVMIENMD